MDSNFGQISGMDLSQSSGGQGVPPVAFPGAPGQNAMTGGTSQGQPQAALPMQVADEPASDEELDREWVNKAKDIVERTKSDPFAQSSELNKAKAEYLKARFNKELNIGNNATQ